LKIKFAISNDSTISDQLQESVASNNKTTILFN